MGVYVIKLVETNITSDEIFIERNYTNCNIWKRKRNFEKNAIYNISNFDKQIFFYGNREISLSQIIKTRMLTQDKRKRWNERKEKGYGKKN